MIGRGRKGIKEKSNYFGHMKTINQFTKNRQFFKITLKKSLFFQEECVTVHTRYQVNP